jgi:stage V sporulation protein SpoVS
LTSVDNPYTAIILHVSASATLDRVIGALADRVLSDARPEIIDIAAVA